MTKESINTTRLRNQYIEEVMHIGKNRINGKIRIFEMKQEGSYVFYVPSFDISSYGGTKAKAFEMLRGEMDSYFSYLFNLTQKKLNAELVRLGWKRNRIRSRDFSKAYIDSDGVLKNITAEFEPKSLKESITTVSAEV